MCAPLLTRTVGLGNDSFGGRELVADTPALCARVPTGAKQTTDLAPLTPRSSTLSRREALEHLS
jgi:hypothetical protein